uniref:Clusterin-associated protein 1 n=1 Tax=Heterorhabditis bacteriophora TaxID=37862 RepID=A0A1I7XAP3_HETBA
MSYRELRNLCEMTRALGYPRLLSIENFRSPNFLLIAELLEWIVKRYYGSRFEPNATLSAQQTSTEQDRILFIKQAVLLLLQNSRLKLNPRRLYQADGHAVQDILPAIRLLYDADKQKMSEDLPAKWNAIKAKLNIKRRRNRATSRAIPLAEAEKTVQQSIGTLTAETQEFTTKLNNVASDEAALDEKIERKKREYEQMQKRYVKLQDMLFCELPQQDELGTTEYYSCQLINVLNAIEQKRPFIGQGSQNVYVLKFRNLAYLQQLHLDIEKADRQRQVTIGKNALIHRILYYHDPKMRINANSSILYKNGIKILHTVGNF